MDEKPFREERRRSERIDAAFTLSYSVEKPFTLRISLGVAEDIDAIMLNLSDLGMAIITKYDIPPETQLYLKFNIIDLRLTGEDRRKHMEMTAETVSNVIIPKASHRIGIRFDTISEEDKDAIRNFVKRNKIPSR